MADGETIDEDPTD